MGIGTLLVRRSLWAVVVVLAAVSFVFILSRYAGDPVLIITGGKATPEAAARLRHQLGLDLPAYLQYARYVNDLAHGNFGASQTLQPGAPVSNLLKRCIKVTAPINIASLILGYLFGVGAGIVAAAKKDTLVDRIIVTLAVVGISIPTFVIIPVLQVIFILHLKILPPPLWRGFMSSGIILPIVVLAIGTFAVITRQLRASVIETLQANFITTAHAKGLPVSTVFRRHILRAALIPIITLFGFSFASLFFAGSFITETLLGIPGCGRLAFDAFSSRDYPIIVAFTVLGSAGYVIANTIAEIFYGIADPRMREAMR